MLLIPRIAWDRALARYMLGSPALDRSKGHAGMASQSTTTVATIIFGGSKVMPPQFISSRTGKNTMATTDQYTSLICAGLHRSVRAPNSKLLFRMSSTRCVRTNLERKLRDGMDMAWPRRVYSRRSCDSIIVFGRCYWSFLSLFVSFK